MALPKGWDETVNEWRRRLRSPSDFTRIRPKPLEGVAGVYMVGGPLKKGTRGYSSHEPGAFVPQALRFKKESWGLTDAVGWYEASRFALHADNPPAPANPIAGRVGLYVHAIQGQAALYMKALKKQHDQTQAGRKPSLKTMLQLESYQERIFRLATLMGVEGAPLELPPYGLTEPLEGGRRENPARVPVCVSHVTTRKVQQEWYETTSGDARVRARELRKLGYHVSVEGMGSQVTPLGRLNLTLVTFEHGGEPPPPHCEHFRGNPPLENPPPARLEAFRGAAMDSIERLAKVETELSAATAQAMEAGERGAVPEWLLNKVRGLHLELRGLTEQVKVAVARHGAALGEFSVDRPPQGPGEPRRSLRNPSRSERAAAIQRFEEFHGARPENYTFRHIPDLSKLVTLGRALEIHYQTHVPRGSRNTPYRHEFGEDATLLTDATGKALVILGNKINVGRAPRGRLGYIRG